MMPKKLHRNDLESPEGLLAALLEFFPNFACKELHKEIRESPVPFHCIMNEFSCWFDAELADQSQLKNLALLIEKSVEKTDDLENAIGTCFLEHLSQIDRRHVLKKHFSRTVRDYMSAHC